MQAQYTREIRRNSNNTVNINSNISDQLSMKSLINVHKTVSRMPPGIDTLHTYTLSIDFYTMSPKREAIFDIISPSVEIFLQFLFR